MFVCACEIVACLFVCRFAYVLSLFECSMALDYMKYTNITCQLRYVNHLEVCKICPTCGMQAIRKYQTTLCTMC